MMANLLTHQRFADAARRGVAWIEAQQRTDGSFCHPDDGVGGYYKVPYALALAGHQRQALQLLAWVSRHHVTAEGDFRAPQRKAREPAHDAWPVYANAWLIQGAHRVGRWDLSQAGAAFLLANQNPAGGFLAIDGDSRYLEPVCTAWGGLALLATGHVAAACHAGDLLVRLVAAQPSADRFYYRMEPSGDLITSVPAGQALSYVVDATQRKQIYFNPGIALICLAYLYRATKREAYLRAANDIFLFAERCADDVYRFPPSGKLGMGCALLYALTGNLAARRAAEAVGDYLLDTQQPEGFWRLPDEKAYAAVVDKDGAEVRLDLTAEFCAFLTEMSFYL
jgi:hypothetical protein